MQDSNKTVVPNVMTALWITVCIILVCMVFFTVNLQLINIARQIIDSSHNGTVPVQVSRDQQQQDDELRCDFTGSDVQEVHCHVASFLAS